VLVDEFQDVNQVQYRLLRALAERHRNLVVVGDDDQAIYGWRGADVRLLLDFERDWPDARIIKLEENYRSSQLILDAAHAVVTRNPHRHDKRLFTRREGGEPILFHRALDERAEASFVVQALLYLSADEGYELADCAVIYRTNAQSRVLEESLRAADVPYSVVGGMRFYDRAEVKDVLAYLRLCNNPADELALRRVINVPARGIGKETVGKLEAHARLGGVPLWQVAQDAVHSPTLLSAGPRKKLGAFVSLVQDLRALVGTVSIAELAKQAVQRTGYLLALDPEDPEDESRRQNVQELLGSIEEQERESRERIREAKADAQQPGAQAQGAATDLLMLEDENQPLTLASYLTRVALQSGDELPDAHGATGPTRGVRLLTAHAAKGLEFKVVVVTGLEDGLFPSLRQGMIESDEELQARLCEERRLAYVALTRARERLLLTCASTRRLYGGQARIAPVSRFVQEIPKQLLDPKSSQRTASGPPSWVAQAIGLRVSDHDIEDRGHAIDPSDPGGLRLVREEEELPTRYGTTMQRASGDDVAAALWSRGRHAAARAQSGSRLAPPRSDEVRIEYEDGQGPRRGTGAAGSAAQGGGLHVGQPVRHGRFGTGRVTAISTGRGVLATVRFDSGESKTIDARFIEPAVPDGARDEFDGFDAPEGS
jgi:DNA helicase-2/ATP-dependent DNA helicase PcrA